MPEVLEAKAFTLAQLESIPCVQIEKCFVRIARNPSQTSQDGENQSRLLVGSLLRGLKAGSQPRDHFTDATT